MITCSSCQRTKPDEEFYWKVENVRRKTSCKECHKVYRKAHYEANKQKYIDKAKRWDAANRNQIREGLLDEIWLRLQIGCSDCDEKDPIVLEFDHRDPAQKSFNISTMIRRVTTKPRLRRELDKCDVVCANCHRRRTAKMFGSWRLTHD